jgi:mono/diheme cytochrome c family protein
MSRKRRPSVPAKGPPERAEKGPAKSPPDTTERKPAKSTTGRAWLGPGVAFALAAAAGGVVSTASAGHVAPEVVLDPSPGLTRPPADTVLPAGEGRSLLERRCGVCHALGLVFQQRLSTEAWKNEVKKMRGWGAFLDDDEAAKVEQFLAANFGRDRPRYEPGLMNPREAEIPTRAESVVGGKGDGAKGAELYRANCAVCHGDSAEGARGPALRDRPIATQPFRFAAAIRAGRGDMPGYPSFETAAVADLFAFVRGR